MGYFRTLPKYASFFPEEIPDLDWYRLTTATAKEYFTGDQIRKNASSIKTDLTKLLAIWEEKCAPNGVIPSGLGDENLLLTLQMEYKC